MNPREWNIASECSAGCVDWWFAAGLWASTLVGAIIGMQLALWWLRRKP